MILNDEIVLQIVFDSHYKYKIFNMLIRVQISCQEIKDNENLRL